MATITIDESLVTKIHSLLDYGLPTGLGEPEPGSMCVEAAINYALGRPHGDDPGCVWPSLRRVKIGLNDARWSSNTARAEGLRRLAIIQLGTLDMPWSLVARSCYRPLSNAHTSA